MRNDNSYINASIHLDLTESKEASINKIIFFSAQKKVKPFNKRTIDIILFEKYAELNRRPQANKLYNYFINSSKNNYQISVWKI